MENLSSSKMMMLVQSHLGPEVNLTILKLTSIKLSSLINLPI